MFSLYGVRSDCVYEKGGGAHGFESHVRKARLTVGDTCNAFCDIGFQPKAGFVQPVLYKCEAATQSWVSVSGSILECTLLQLDL